MLDSTTFTATVPHHSSYLGDKITSVVIAVLPLVLRVDSGDLWDRAFLAVCGAAGSGIAIVVDPPASWREGAGRIFIGFLVCALFAPWLAVRYGFADQINSLVAAAGVMGIISWYMAGTGVRGMRRLKESEWIAKNAPGLLRNWALRMLAGNTAAEIIKSLPQEVLERPVPTTPNPKSNPPKPNPPAAPLV